LLEFHRLFVSFIPCLRCLLGASQLVRIFAPSENDKFPPKKFTDKVQDHGGGLDDVLVDTGTGSQLTKPSRHGNEDGVKNAHFKHGDGYVVCRFERVASVQGEVPKDGQHDGDDVLDVVGPCGQLV
jgi:hypothetical protein